MSKYPNLFAELIRRNYTTEDVKKIAGANLLRVFDAAEAFKLDAAQNATLSKPEEAKLPPDTFYPLLPLLSNVTGPEWKSPFAQVTNNTCRPTAGTSGEPD